MNYYRNLILLGFTILLFNCGGGSSNNNNPAPVPEPSDSDFYEPVSQDLPIANAADVGLKPADIGLAYEMAATNPSLLSMLVIKDNQLVAEAYFNRASASSKLHLRSVTKTVTAMLVGIAIEQGLLVSTDQTIGEFLLQDYPALSADKADITISQLLTMSSGFDWDESTSAGYFSWENSADPVLYLLNRALSDAPGVQFNYNSAAVHLLAVILDKLTQGGLDTFVTQNLFNPLGITDVSWDRLNDGLVNGGAGIQLKPIDTAKLALMLLNDGRYNNQQIVPELWVKQAKKQQIAFAGGSPYGDMTFTGYGYLWWQGTGNTQKIDLAWGWGGQFIATVQEHNLIVVTNSVSQVQAPQANVQAVDNLSLIINGIISALE